MKSWILLWWIGAGTFTVGDQRFEVFIDTNSLAEKCKTLVPNRVRIFEATEYELELVENPSLSPKLLDHKHDWICHHIEYYPCILDKKLTYDDFIEHCYIQKCLFCGKTRTGIKE